MKNKNNKEEKEYVVLHLVIASFVFVVLIAITLSLMNPSKEDCVANPPMVSSCEKYNIEELNNCVREGYTGTGFLGMTDFNTDYWVCEDYGRIARYCISWREASPSNLTSDWEHCK